MSKINSPSVVEFLKTIWIDWATKVSGIFSVPFTFLALFLDQKYGKTLWIILASICLVLTCYFVWANERKKVFRLINEYAHCIRLISVNVGDNRELDAESKIQQRKIGFQLVWKNTLVRPVHYQVEKIEIEGSRFLIGKGDEVISPLSETTFFTALFEVPPPTGNRPEVYIMILEVLYGPPDLPPNRKITKKMSVTLFPESKQTNFIYEINSDEPYEL